mmetsp:Transcript_12216/g.23376  ORF Transcript_12216/g.23376 Transcript_12216/m.23376 type:complete len:231 (-) Transcript_12216:61-753(-)
MKLFRRLQPKSKRREARCLDARSSFKSLAAKMTDLGDEESTIDSSCERSGLPSSWTIPQAPRRHRVVFCEEHPQTYECPWGTQDEDKTVAWYDSSDIAKFKSDTSIFARLVLTREKQKPQLNSWSKSLSTVYQGLCSAKTVSEMNQILGAALEEEPIDPRYVALEKWALPELGLPRTKLRRELYAEVHLLQSFRGLSGVERDRLIRQTSLSYSRPNRLFAIYLGRLVHQQ